MTARPIQPALTPEEWALCSPPELFAVDDSLIAVDSRAKEPAEIRARSIDVSTRPHAIAAVALYGQPFGFTREDVAWLRATGHTEFDVYHPGQPCCDPVAREAVLRAIADRIEALLPTYDMTANQVVDFPVSALFPPARTD